MTDTIKHFEQQTSSTMCSVLYLCSSKNQVLIFHTEQSYDRLKFETSAAQNKKKKKKTKKKLKKMHLGQVFQSVTSFETYNFFSLA